MTDPIALTEIEAKALRDQATIDFVTVVCTTIEMAAVDHDITSWVAEHTAHWTADHARQAVLLFGMLVSSTELTTDDVATMGKLLLGD